MAIRLTEKIRKRHRAPPEADDGGPATAPRGRPCRTQASDGAAGSLGRAAHYALADQAPELPLPAWASPRASLVQRQAADRPSPESGTGWNAASRIANRVRTVRAILLRQNWYAGDAEVKGLLEVKSVATAGGTKTTTKSAIESLGSLSQS
jgi:hypothetical protein